MQPNGCELSGPHTSYNEEDRFQPIELRVLGSRSGVRSGEFLYGHGTSFQSIGWLLGPSCESAQYWFHELFRPMFFLCIASTSINFISENGIVAVLGDEDQFVKSFIRGIKNPSRKRGSIALNCRSLLEANL